MTSRAIQKRRRQGLTRRQRGQARDRSERAMERGRWIILTASWGQLERICERHGLSMRDVDDVLAGRHRCGRPVPAGAVCGMCVAELLGLHGLPPPKRRTWTSATLHIGGQSFPIGGLTFDGTSWDERASETSGEELGVSAAAPSDLAPKDSGGVPSGSPGPETAAREGVSSAIDQIGSSKHGADAEDDIPW